MMYRVVDTTDGQHRGDTVTIAPGAKFFSMLDGDTINFYRFKSLGDGFYKTISYNYVAVLELIP